MSSRISNAQQIDGTVYKLPFLGGVPAERIGSIYANLVSKYEASEVLVLKRFPTGIETFTDRLAAVTDGVERPRVRSVNRHAKSLLDSVPDPPTQLSDTERGELAYRFLLRTDWESPYLEQASKHDRFQTDLPRITKVVSWRGEPIQSSHPVLDEIGTHQEAFQEWLEDLGYLERGAVIPRVIDALSTGRIELSALDVSAILVIEFEEFAASDRVYLDRLATHAEGGLHCVAQTDSSIQRVWNESGTVSETITETDADTLGGETIPTRPKAVANLFATGETVSDPDDGAVEIVHEATFRDQVRKVADEIERLREANGWSYDEFAIGFKDANEPISETVRVLQQAGIPTASASVSGFADDPSVRELRTVVQHYASGDAESQTHVAEGVDLDSSLVDMITTEDDSLERALRRYALETGLKERIAADHDPLEAKAQFGHVQDVFGLAEFLDELSIVEATWSELGTTLDRAVKNATAEVQTAEVDVREDGVLVDAVRVMKNASWKAVFMLNLVEGTYPSGPNLTGLFPTTEVASMEDFPGVTDVTASDVRETFSTADGPIQDPFRRYYKELTRRQLAVGSRAATERLYLGLFSEESGELNRQLQPSRYLIEAVEQFPWITGLDHEAIYGQSGAIKFALSRADQALASIRGAGVRGETIDLDEVQRDFGGIQELITASGNRGKKLREAIAARVDFAAGEVRRNE
ncbi:DNA helicase UvrD [Halodesulfurarchaeum sp.]|uniref:DNA helicase UvrD n=1 Tax=Halodesulfurarchaeum sp. TaxID=1980530 RepID=UPI002FC28DE9